MNLKIKLYKKSNMKLIVPSLLVAKVEMQLENTDLYEKVRNIKVITK